MPVASVEFFVFVALLCLIYHLYNSPRWRMWVMAAANTLFVATFVYRPIQALLLVWMLGSGYWMVRLIQARVVRSAVVVGFHVLSYVAIFAILRQGLPGPAMGASDVARLSLVGYSYFMFKQIHMLIDSFQGQLRPIGPLLYLNYMCGLYTWTAGPIQRFNSFSDQVRADRPPPSARDVLLALNRVVDGAFKAFVIAVWVSHRVGPDQVLIHAHDASFWWRFAVFFYGYYLYLYLNFSGYCDIVIGLAAVLGIRLPENFNRPYVARNVLDFWQRWHMSLTHWLRDYIFNFTYRALLSVVPLSAGLTAGVAYLVTFDVAGIWHGWTPNFALFGILHGAGACFNQVGDTIIRRVLSRERRFRYRRHPLIRAVATGLCATYVAFTMLIFAYPFGQLQQIWDVVMSHSKGAANI